MMPRFTGAAVAAALVAASLTGCTEQSLIVDGSTVTVATQHAVTSLNERTTFGNTPANVALAAAVSSGFSYYSADRTLVSDESFGSVTVVSQDPFAVEYRVAEGVTWSDGVPIDSADLLLAWAANSGALSTEGFEPSRYVDAATGQFEEFPDDVVYFDGATRSGLQHVTEVPELGDDGRSITLTYDEYFSDWELAFQVGQPAHVVVEQAMTVRGTDSEPKHAKAKRLLIEAVQDADAASLAPIAAAWNSAFNLGEEPLDPDLLVSSGPYAISEIDEDAVTLTANPRYTGDRKPRFESVVLRTITDPLAAVTALREGEVDVISPPPTEDVLDALADIDDVETRVTDSGQFEHLDLQFSRSKNGSFDNADVREAFLLVVPRTEIVDQLVRPIAPDAETRDSFVLAPGSSAYDAAVEANADRIVPEVDVDAAKRLLQRAGVTAPEVCVLFDPANPRRVDEFTLIQQSAARAGFRVTDCSSPDWEDFLGVTAAYDAALFAWNEVTAAISSPAARLASGSVVSNFSHYSNEEVDLLLATLAVEPDAGERDRLLAEIDAALWEDAYGLPLYQFPSLVAVRGGIENVAPSALTPGLTWNIWEWQPATKTT